VTGQYELGKRFDPMSKSPAPTVWAFLSLCICLVVACDVYDAKLAELDSPTPPSPSDCVPTTEVCNNKDDDCDNVIDEAEAVRFSCEQLIVHADVACQEGLCVKKPGCWSGYYNCDGNPRNGCESTCVCSLCGDDGGVDRDE
jgi:hypothetical protein